jgi:ATP-binding protein involved in chromosome partitioning
MLFGSKNTVKSADVLTALSKIQDPDLNKDIVTLGFVKNLEIQGGEVRFIVELTTPACPVKEQLKSQCVEEVKKIPGVTEVKVEMTASVKTSQPQANRLSLPTVKNVIAVASGKGGVGKSTVAVNLAVALSQMGAKVGLLDADIYGPSIPMMLGTKEKPYQKENRILPVERHGIRMMSMGFLIPENQPVVWRGPMVHGALTQFMTQVEWGDLDYLFIDMPPGTGDAQLTISQNAPLAGAVIVTTPQEVSILDARRGLMMFQSVQVPVFGIIENMSGYQIPGSNDIIPIFGKGGGQRIATEMGTQLLGSIPIDPRVTESGDAGTPLVIQYPDSPVAMAFTKLAKELASQISILNSKSAQNFQPIGLQW